MRLRVEHVVVEVDGALVVGEEQVEVLERLAEEEGLHRVARVQVLRVADVAYAGVAAGRYLRVLLKGLSWTHTDTNAVC